MKTVSLRSSFAINEEGTDQPEKAAISEQLGEDIISVYPNPVKENLYLRIESTELNYTFKLFDLSGNLLQNRQIDLSSEQTLPMNTYSAGIYMLRLQKEDNESVFKIIKE